MKSLWNKYKELAIFSLLISLFVQNCQNKHNELTLNDDYFKQMAEIQALNKINNALEKQLHNQQLTTKHYEDSISKINIKVGDYLANPNKSTIDSLWAIYNP